MFRSAALALALLAAAPLAQDALAQDALTPAQQQAVDARIRAYLLENPEIIIEAMQALEAKQAVAQAGTDARLIAQHAEALFEDARSPVLGDPQGDVTIVEFADYRCGYCKAAQPEIEALLAADPNIRLVMKEFPILGPESVLAARAALAAERVEPEAYAAFHEAMMNARGQLDEATVFDLAEEAGLDREALREAMAAPEIEAAIGDNHALARALGVTGTPGFVIGDRIVRGYVDQAELERLVAEARGKQG